MSDDALSSGVRLNGERFDDLPNAVRPGGQILLACTEDPAAANIGIDLLTHYTSTGDHSVVVTTQADAESVLSVFEKIAGDTDHSSLSVLDSSGTKPAASDLYRAVPIVRIPSPINLERLVTGLAEITGQSRPHSGNRSLLVRSLTPLLERDSVERVLPIVDRIGGICSGTGLSLFGLDYTAHDEGTVNQLANRMDGVLWISKPSADGYAVEYRQNRDRAK